MTTWYFLPSLPVTNWREFGISGIPVCGVELGNAMFGR
jgi:hypothetical protein